MPPKPSKDPKAKERGVAFSGCDRFLAGHGARSMANTIAEMQAEIQDSDRADYYSFGKTLNDFEVDVAQRLGKDAAVFMPSGTMAQQIALRIWCDEVGHKCVAFHPTCHLELHTSDSLEHLHGIHRVLVGERRSLITMDDLEDLAVPVSAILLELPQREIGGFLPTWEALTAQCEWARNKGIKIHMDGARLWEAQPFYQKSLAEICALFDSVYVAGAVLLGDSDYIAQAKVWQQRHGGTLIHHYPTVLSARAGLKKRIDKFESYHKRALEVAKVLSAIPDVSVSPNPPHSHMMHVYLRRDRDRALDASAEVAKQEKVRLFHYLVPMESPGVCKFELCLGDSVEALSNEEIDTLFRKVMALSAVESA
ncbi:MAG: beta-eliminating lyase-related protein [Planctomycetota bacterium]|nr:beta-eliminating lyase-related protein [Planctomycetota bacterium]